MTFSEPTAIDEHAYMSLLQRVCQMARDDKHMQVRLIGLHALEGVVSSDLFYAVDFRRQAQLVVQALVMDLIDGKVDPSDFKEYVQLINFRSLRD